MPRPDIKALGVEYRRIPILTIGRDIYHDTRIILAKLERLFPASAAHPSISSSKPEEKEIERLLEYWIIDGGVFTRASQLIPTSMPLLKDPKFTKDRENYTGRSWDKSAMEAVRPEALVDIKGAFAFLEETLLADGRDWILKTESPTLADIEGKPYPSRIQVP
jgi:glutathione S-transferase